MAVPPCIHPQGSVELAVDRLKFAIDRLVEQRKADPKRVPFTVSWIRKIVGELESSVNAEVP